MNRIEAIVEKLSKHELSKYDSVNMLQALFDEQRRKESVEFVSIFYSNGRQATLF